MSTRRTCVTIETQRVVEKCDWSELRPLRKLCMAVWVDESHERRYNISSEGMKLQQIKADLDDAGNSWGAGVTSMRNPVPDFAMLGVQRVVWLILS